MSALYRGCRGPEVREFQGHLVRWGYPLVVDGDFGPATERAVVAFQLAEGLVADGLVGRRTWRELADGPAPAPAPDDRPLALAIAAAVADLGAAEEPPGSNAGPAISHLVEGYGDHWQIADYEPYPWCGMAVSVWTARALGLGQRGDQVDWARHPFGAWFGGVEQIRAWAIEHGRIIAPTAGAIYVMGRDGSGSDAGPIEAGHTGLVEAVDGAHVVCIDGNVSNRVKRMRRPIVGVRAFVRWW